jgi:hypothetical protein
MSDVRESLSCVFSLLTMQGARIMPKQSLKKATVKAQHISLPEPQVVARQPSLKIVQEAPKSYGFPIHRVYKLFQSYFRPRRKKAFTNLFPEVALGAPVVDVGGTAGWWREDFPKGLKVAIVNIDDDHRDDGMRCGFSFFKADGRKLLFADKQFHLTFSNSVIEHGGDLEDQKRFGQEAMRCSRKFYLQTPNKWLAVELHYMTVFVQWLPFKFARRLLRYCSIWGLVAKPSQQQIDEMLLTTRLLSKAQLREIFPAARIMEEKFLGQAKSFIGVIEQASESQSSAGMTQCVAGFADQHGGIFQSRSRR